MSMLVLMNFVPHLSIIACACCGEARRESETVVDAGEAVCFACHEDSQARAALQLAKERADQFQWLSGEWFAERSPAAQDRKSCDREDESYYAEAYTPFEATRAAQYSVGK